MAPRRRLTVWLALLLVTSAAWADKVIMKNGKIYQGRIMGETNHSVLISNPPQDPQPHFLQYDDILTIVRDQPVPMASTDLQRTLVGEISLAGHVFSPDSIRLDAAPGLHLAGGLRPHPLFEADAFLDWIPGINGHASVTDGTTTRSYEHFGAYSGGFQLRLFPLYRLNRLAWEPYVIGGYGWNRLFMKDSGGDQLKGHSWQAGLGVLHPWRWHLYWDLRFLYERVTYDAIEFLLREGSLSQSINDPTYTFSLGLAYRY